MTNCNRVYERIATGELPSRLVYDNFEHGVMVLLDPMPVAEGHLAIASLACTPSVDAIESPVLHNKMYTVAKFAGRVLAQAYPEAPYIGELTASNQIRHPHIHRVPGDNDAQWVKRFAKLEDWPRLQLSSDHMDDIKGRLTDLGAIRKLWQACDAEVVALGAPDEATVQAAQELGLLLPR
jgi:diadenosine tetraphosphate (Ap4A) HIT family hydrolase